MNSTHSARLERWLGVEEVERLSRNMRDWYGPPIAVHNIPGKVYATRGGDFTGAIDGGHHSSLMDCAENFVRRLKRASRVCSRAQALTMNAGFASLSDLIAEATGGKRREFVFQKVSTTGAADATGSLWGVGSVPAAGGAGSAAPDGRACDDATVGGHPFTNPGGGDTLHIVNGYSLASLANTLLLYDRIFDVAKTMNSTTDEAVTGVPTRYQSSTPADANYAGGNFLFVEIFATLAATAHNWANCTYRNQAGTDSQALPSLTGISGGVINRIDHPTNQWFAPLASGDTGIMDLAQIDCSAAVATGAINFVIGHPIAWLPCPSAGLLFQWDFINTAFNLTRIFDDACLALLEVIKPAATATTYNSTVTAVFG